MADGEPTPTGVQAPEAVAPVNTPPVTEGGAPTSSGTFADNAAAASASARQAEAATGAFRQGGEPNTPAWNLPRVVGGQPVRNVDAATNWGQGAPGQSDAEKAAAETRATPTEMPASAVPTEVTPPAAEATPQPEQTEDLSLPNLVKKLLPQRMLSEADYKVFEAYQDTNRTTAAVAQEFGMEVNDVRNIARRVTRALSGINFENIDSAEKIPLIIKPGETTVKDINGVEFATQKTMAEELGVDVKTLHDKLRSRMENGQVATVEGFEGTARKKNLVNADQVRRAWQMIQGEASTDAVSPSVEATTPEIPASPATEEAPEPQIDLPETEEKIAA